MKFELGAASIETPSLVPASMFAKLPLRLYDPGFRNTAVCFSKISNTDNDKLLYRGYNVEELVDKSSFLEVSYLLIYGSLPSHNQYREYVYNVLHHTYLHSELEHQMSAFRYDSHPMAMLISSIASLSTFHPEANPAVNGENMYLYQKDSAQNSSVFNSRQKAIFRMLGKIPTIAANAFRLRQGRSFNPPMPTNNYCENILYMMDKMNDLDYRPNPQLVRILDKLFIILAENQSTCSTVMIRHLASSGVDPYTALSGAAGALFGERKSTVIIQMLTSLEKNANVATFLDSIANPSGKRPKLYGFGHVVYKTDPRANMAKKLLLEVC
jgi:citrate synthase